ncbi:MAG: DUF1573 domain-containing protein [Bacteroidales bacterium]|nr:DUF1573 domain-containing protein [Bacteroidales bacterium]
MKSLMLIATMGCTALIGTSTMAQPQAANGPIIKIQADTVNLGEIFIDELTVNHGKLQITVANSGNQPLIMQKVSGCCGTNIKQWSKAPILPGKEGSIDVEFRIEPKPQVISRTVTVESNASNERSKKIHIRGIVAERKAANELTL